MNLISTPISGLIVAETTSLQDKRGTFTRLFCGIDLVSVIGEKHIIQINHSRTYSEGAVRGMHYQHTPHAEIKMVRCLSGRVWDVAVDLRQGSSTFLRWYAKELTPDNGLMMVIPEGCAHGFQTLQTNSELLYLHTAAYNPDAENGVRYDDPAIGIDWPLTVTDLSKRDKDLPYINNEFQGLKS